MNQTFLPLGSTISVELSELDPLSNQLSEVASRYEETGDALLGITSQVALLAPLDISGNGAQALASLGVSSTGLIALVTGTRHLAQAVRLSSQAYNDAETFALVIMSGFKTAANEGRSIALAYGSAFGYRVHSLKIKVIENGRVLVRSTPKAPWCFLDSFRKTPEGCAALARIALLLNSYTQKSGKTGRLRATREMTDDLFADGAESAKFMGAVPTTPQEVTYRIGQVSEIEELGDTYMARKGYQGEWDHIVVETLVNPTTGETMYLVTIPGTDGKFWEALLNPPRGGVNSWTGTVGTVSSGSPNLSPDEYTALMSLVEQAMQDAGVPEGANVSFMGFSQGATAATAVANNDTFNSRYKVKGLVTQAGPVDHIKVRDDVIHVDLRHKDDYVPMLSGDRPDYKPDESYIYTATPSSGDTHGAQVYQEMASLETQAQQPLEGLEEIFGGYVSVNADIYAGTTQKPGITKEEQAVIGTLGAANIALEGTTENGIDINPADLYQDTEEFIQSVERGLSGVSIGGIEIFDPILEPTHPGSGSDKPPVSVPDHKIKVYEATPQDHLENLGKLLGVPDIPAGGLNDSIQIFEPELIAG